MPLTDDGTRVQEPRLPDTAMDITRFYKMVQDRGGYDQVRPTHHFLSAHDLMHGP
jgi:hypothetical protein